MASVDIDSVPAPPISNTVTDSVPGPSIPPPRATDIRPDATLVFPHECESYAAVLRWNETRFPQYNTYEARLRSYLRWPRIYPTPENLSAAGFWYTGEFTGDSRQVKIFIYIFKNFNASSLITGVHDIVRCFHCAGSLMDWQHIDYPFYEHSIYYPHCFYLNYVKGKRFVKDCQQIHMENNRDTATRLVFPM
jgi:hypothetical protein